MLNEDSVNRFWSRVNVCGPDECWEWSAKKDRDGYGVISVLGSRMRAHRMSWEIHNGPVPKGQLVCHTCDNPPCVNPAHLWVGTEKENMGDKLRKGRTSTGEKHGNARFTTDEIVEIRRMYSSGEYTTRQLAAMNKTSRSHIHRIVTGESWWVADGGVS